GGAHLGRELTDARAAVALQRSRDRSVERGVVALERTVRSGCCHVRLLDAVRRRWAASSRICTPERADPRYGRGYAILCRTRCPLCPADDRREGFSAVLLGSRRGCRWSIVDASGACSASRSHRARELSMSVAQAPSNPHRRAL